ncbi:MAG: nitroreductase family protein [Clostridia bacterium]|nr:nitroreductase family protein [Clostridia bacterium]
MNKTLQLIASRRSHRAYEQKQITAEQRAALLDAAVQSPSAVNRQPWHFTLVQNKDLLNKINQYCVENARSKTDASPRFLQEDYHVFYHAPTVIFISGPKNTSWAPIDCGIAVQNIAIAAESMELGSVILGMPREAFQSIHGDEVRAELAFPEGHDFIIAIAVGYPADTKDAHVVEPNKIHIIE